MRRIFINNPFFRIFGPPVFGVMVYLLLLLINNNVAQLAELFSNQEVYVSILLSLVSFESMRISLILLEKVRLPVNRKLMIQLIATTVVSVAAVWVVISQYYHWIIGYDISMREMVLFGVIFGFTSLLFNALYTGNVYLQMENTSRIEQEQKLRENLEHEFLSFRQEINPDLLYESLEELILSLHHKSDIAEELIDSLAALYRYQLIHRQKEFVSLTEELQAVNHLLRLANQKHRNCIKWDNQLEKTDDIQLMPGSLLLAIDSIVRNTLISEDRPLVLTLMPEDEEYFMLHHLLNEKLQTHPQSLEAFQRLQRSYSVYSDRPFVQVKAGNENYIKFPLIKVDHAVNEPA